MKVLVAFLVLLVVPYLANCSTCSQDDAHDQAKADTNDGIQDNLESILQGDPILSGASVQATVDDQTITLTGTVESYAQHQRVLQLVEPYSGSRKVVDKIKIPNPQTKTARSRFGGSGQSET